ncbi:MAG: hypothetical protein ACR2HO_05995 [Rubrobacteraceae bacterium]|nr:hypothetical protein [Rubrobacter sp.]
MTRVRWEGQTLSFYPFYYLKRRTSIVVVPVASVDAVSGFNEQTGNYQAVTIQDQLTYRIVEPFAGAKAVAPVREGFRFAWDVPRLCFSVREPFVSKASVAGIVWGNVRAGERLNVVSRMPQDDVIFSDGVEADYLAFDSSAVANIFVAEEEARLVAAYW